ncbi:MAG: LCP family protein [Bulleidia sp.]
MSNKQVRHTKQADQTRFHRDMTQANLIVTILTVITNLLVIYTMMNTTRFSSLSKKDFILVNVLCLIVLLVMNAAVMYGIRRKKKTVYITGIVLMCVFLVIGGYGTYAVTRVNSSVNKITSTTTTESVSTSLVVYSETGTQTITDVSQLDGKTVGYATGTSTAELGKNQIDAKGINVNYEEYTDYSSEILALFNNEIQCAILPTNYQSMFQNETSLADLLANTASILDFEDKVTVENDSGSDIDITTTPFTVLLIGNADGLSDTLILCSVNPISMKVTMTSIARDSYVPISCYNGASSKINSAHAVSVGCTIQTVEDLTGVNIDYYVDTNFQGVVDIVDALGGIVVNSPVEFVGQTSSSTRGTYTVWVPAGDNVLLDGEQALAFARERHAFATGDFARQEHQQEVIEAIVRTILRTRDINTFLKVLDAAGDNIQTNLSVEQMTSFVSYALQKTNRYYDSEHPENVFNIQSGRITGYNSGLWDEGLQITLSIVRIWQGALADAKAVIDRNIDMTTAITPMTSVQWSANWIFEIPAICQETYNETMVQDTLPTTIGNYVGRDIGTLQSFCSSYGLTLNITYVQDSSQANGIIVAQDPSEGTSIDSIAAVNVTVVDNSASATPTPTAAPDTSSEAGCTASGMYWYNNTCNSSPQETSAPTAAPEATATPTPTPEPTPTPTPEPTPTPTPESTPTPEATPTPETANEETQASPGS